MSQFAPFGSMFPKRNSLNCADAQRRRGWRDQETVADRSDGVQLATMKELMRRLGYTRYVSQVWIGKQ